MHAHTHVHSSTDGVTFPSTRTLPEGMPVHLWVAPIARAGCSPSLRTDGHVGTRAGPCSAGPSTDSRGDGPRLYTHSVLPNKGKHLSTDNTGLQHVYLGAAEGTPGEGRGSRAFPRSQSLRQACGCGGQGEPKREAGGRGGHSPALEARALTSDPCPPLTPLGPLWGAWAPRAALRRGSLRTLTLVGLQRVAPGVGGLQGVCAAGGMLYRNVRGRPGLQPLQTLETAAGHPHSPRRHPT